ncbi:HNH endonuclease [Burkholderia cepacia]|uniref:HNH endonuclease n=1 Tax=Burkholderia cepacia TaxID=292 RepID=UPI000757FBBF|nr:HNH endonuclease domain-containing protein [Burkholderia cepacia]KVU51556.1 hypothetical protein WK70_31680 [Burkholderia cepacia]
MSDIANPVVYTDEQNALVAAKRNDAAFTHHDWGHVELEAFRSHVRNHYRTEQRGICAFCREHVSLQAAENCQVEHIVPKSIRPEFMFEPKNLCVICADCNTIKRDQEVTATIPDTVAPRRGRQRYPRASSSFLIVHPHFDRYSDHILIERGHYFDRTDKGHFTIGACKLNRRLRVFGWDERIVEEPKLMDAAQQLLESKPGVERQAALQRIREVLQ